MEIKKRSTNILILNKVFNPYGGVARSLVYLSEGVRSRSVRFHFGSFEPCDKYLENELIHGYHKVVYFYTNKTGGIDILFKLREYIKINNICLIYCCCFRSFFLAKLASGFSKKVVFWGHSCRDLVFTTSPKLLKLFIFNMLLNNGWIVCNSVYSLQSYFRKDKTRTKVIYNGVKKYSIISKEEAKNILGLPNNAIILTYVGGYNIWKDHSTLIKAFYSLAQQYNDICLIICGNLGSIETDLIVPLFRETELRKRLYLFSPRKDISIILSATDIYVHTCYKEGFGNIVAEAMRVGIPVVVAKAGALPEVVGDAGLFFESQDHLSLENKIIALLKNNNDYNILSQKARTRGECFSTVAFAQRFLNTLNEIILDVGKRC